MFLYYTAFLIFLFKCLLLVQIMFYTILGNAVDMMDIAKTFIFQGILNATVSVDTFFLLRYYMCHIVLVKAAEQFALGIGDLQNMTLFTYAKNVVLVLCWFSKANCRCSVSVQFFAVRCAVCSPSALFVR